MLLDAKADANGGKVIVPLIAAIRAQDAVSAGLLLQAGANPDLKSTIYETNSPSRRSSKIFNPHVPGRGHQTTSDGGPAAEISRPTRTIRKMVAVRALFQALAETNILESLLGRWRKS